MFSVPTSLGNAGGAMSAASAAMSQQATRHARRIYVGGLPPSANENNIQTFFSNALAAVGGTTAGPGMCVVNVYINYEKKFAFVEMRTGGWGLGGGCCHARARGVEQRVCVLRSELCGRAAAAGDGLSGLQGSEAAGLCGAWLCLAPPPDPCHHPPSHPITRPQCTPRSRGGLQRNGPGWNHV